MKRFFRSSTRLRIGFVVGTIAALCLAATASARPGGHGGGDCKGGDRLEHRVRALDLDDETRSAVYAVLDKARVARRAQEDELHDARQKMRELLKVDAPEEAVVLAQAERIGELETGLHRERLKTMLNLRGLVGAEAWGELHKEKRRPGKRRPLR